MAMNFRIFENSCAECLRRKYSAAGYEFIVNGGSDPTTPDVVVKKNGNVICRIEVKEPIAQCSQFVAFADVKTRTFTYSKRNHPSKPSEASLAILAEMSKNFDRHKVPSADELGLDKQLYYDRIIDYYLNYKKCDFFMTRESVDAGEFIVFPTADFDDYFDVKACYRSKPSGSHNPNKKVLKELPSILAENNIHRHEIVRDGKYVNVKLDGELQECFVLEGKYRLQFRRIAPGLYRVTSLGTTNNANVIFSISLKSPIKTSNWTALENAIK